MRKSLYLLAKEQGGHPLMPVRLDYREPFQYPLSVYLNGINWSLWWENEELKRAITPSRG
ncbi:MAG: hypothetical protein RMY28_031680 [Nostoc sp. ChiSLP01]